MEERTVSSVDQIQKWVILLAGAGGTPVAGRERIQKAMFLLSDCLRSVGAHTRYEAGRRGPHSRVIDEKVVQLEGAGLLVSNQGGIELSGKGREVAGILEKTEDKEVIELLNEYKEFLSEMTPEEMLTYFYSTYPGMTVKSADYDDLKPMMEHHVLNMVEKHTITASRGSELLGMSLFDFREKMKDRGIAELLL